MNNENRTEAHALYSRHNREAARRGHIILELYLKSKNPASLDEAGLAEDAYNYLMQLPKDDIIHLLAADWDLVILGCGLATEKS